MVSGSGGLGQPNIFPTGASGNRVADDPHSRIHQGVMYHCSTLTASLADNGNLDMIITTPANDYPHMILEAACGGDADFHLYEGVVFTGGATESVPNLKRYSSNVWGGTVVTGATVSTTGTVLLSQFMPGGSKSQAVGSAQEFGLEWVLSASTSYLVRLINRSGSAQRASVGCNHYSSAQIADS